MTKPLAVASNRSRLAPSSGDQGPLQKRNSITYDVQSNGVIVTKNFERCASIQTHSDNTGKSI